MNATDFNAVTYEGAVYCVGCFVGDIDSDPEVSPIFADSEWDYYPTCDACRKVHDYVSLTPDGIRAARERRAGPLAPLLDKEGNLPKWAWGGNAIIYLDKDDCVLCSDCANAALAPDSSDNPPVIQGGHEEGPPLECEECNAEIASDYGDPNAEKE